MCFEFVGVWWYDVVVVVFVVLYEVDVVGSLLVEVDVIDYGVFVVVDVDLYVVVGDW